MSARALVAAIVVLSAAPEASAERVVLASADAELARATETALGPWQVEVVVHEGESLGATMPAAANSARSLAAETSARAVVWTASAASGPSLWIYDVATDKALTVRLPSLPPFDPPTAAALALAIKTLLRYSDVAPATERVAVPAPERRSHVWLEAGLGGRTRPRPAARFEPIFGIAGVLRPFREPRVAFAVGLEAGPGFDVERGDFVGAHRDVTLSAMTRVRVFRSGRLALEPAAGAAVQLSSFEGTDLSRDRHVRARRFNPALVAGLRLAWQLGRVEAGLTVEGTYFLRRQTYTADDMEVFDLPAGAAQAGLGIAVPIW